MNGPHTKAEKTHRLPWIYASDAANTVFCQLTVFGSVFILFLDELGLHKAQIGLLLSLFPFCGIIALFIAPVVASIGFKRTFLIFWGTRKAIVGLFLLTPWVLSRFGSQATFVFVVGILLVFAICRAVAETAWLPWLQEFVPNSIRGKFTATNNMISTLSGCLAAVVAGYVVGKSAGLGRFMGLFAAGVAFGLLCVLCASFIPGGAPLPPGGGRTALFRRMVRALQDRNFRVYLSGAAFVTLGWGPLFSFLPLFMKEEVGLAAGKIVLLQTWTMLGAVLSSYLWGWNADRYGSKPVMLSAMYITIFLPLCWWLMPRHSVWSSSVAAAVAFVCGLAGVGISIGSGRLLFVGVVPAEKKTEYMAIYYAWMGLVGGCGPLVAGRVLDSYKGIEGRFSIFTLDPYTPLFALSLALFLATILSFKRVRADSALISGKPAARLAAASDLCQSPAASAPQDTTRAGPESADKTRT